MEATFVGGDGLGRGALLSAALVDRAVDFTALCDDETERLLTESSLNKILKKQ